MHGKDTHTQEDAQHRLFDVLSREQPVADKAAGYLYWLILSQVRLNLPNYNWLVEALSDQEKMPLFIQQVKRQIADKENDLYSKSGPALEEAQAELTKVNKELLLLNKIQDTLPRVAQVLGRSESWSILSTLKIKDLRPYDAFRNSTRKLEVKHGEKKFNYLVRDVTTMTGETADGDPERHLVREEKDIRERILRHQTVARFVFNKDTDDNYQKLQILDVDTTDPHVVEGCKRLQELYEGELEGASANRLRTAVEHLTNTLSPIPVSALGTVYFCQTEKKPIVDLLRRLIEWVALKYRGKDSKGCEFKAAPLLDTEDNREMIGDSARTFFTARLDKGTAEIISINEEKAVLMKTPALTPAEKETRATKMRELEARARVVRKEVGEIQTQMQAYMKELGEESTRLQQGAATLMVHYKKFMGL